MVADKIKTFRLNSGMTQAEFAAACNLRQNAISQYEAGTRLPRVHALFSIAQYMGCTVEELIRADEEN